VCVSVFVCVCVHRCMISRGCVCMSVFVERECVRECVCLCVCVPMYDE